MRLRRPSLDDRPQVYRWMTSPGVVEQMLGPPTFPDQAVPTYEDFCEDWLAHYWTWETPERGRGFLVIEEDERVGFLAHNDVVRLDDGRRATELDTWLRGPDVIGRGLGPRAIDRLCLLLVRDLAVDVAFLQQSARNPRGIAAYEKARFRRVALDATAAAAHYHTQPDYADSVFLARDLARTTPAFAIGMVVGPGRNRFRPLLRLADDSDEAISGYLNTGTLYVLRLDDQPIGVALLGEQDRDAEVLSIAIDEDHQGEGWGTRLLRHLIEEARAAGRPRLRLATAAADTATLRLYQRLGFRLSSVERDYFVPSRGYPTGLVADGIRVRDRVWLDLDLTSAPAR